MPSETELAVKLQAALGDAYVVRRELGSGGMATVFLATDSKRDREVALKVLRPELAATIGPQRFRREIAVAATLAHPNIMPVHDHGESDGGLLWYSMPYVQGETLRERLQREPQLPLGDALRIAREVAAALGYAHDAGFLHRDVKPDNILITKAHDTLLADFGIARPVPGMEEQVKASIGNKYVPTTTTGFVVGSPQYMSPEQVGGDPTIDARSDQYSLGTVLFEMLAGEPPFGGRNAQAVMMKMFAGVAPSVRPVRPDVPAKVDAAIMRSISRSRNDRFAKISEFADALQVASSEARAGIGEAVSRLATRLRGWRSGS